MNPAHVEFAVIYRWRLRAGKESQFQQAWSHSTPLIARERGGLGSRLHKAEDGTWVAYAQWPSKAAWEKARALESVDPDDSRCMLEAIEESFPPILLVPVADLLIIHTSQQRESLEAP